MKRAETVLLRKYFMFLIPGSSEIEKILKRIKIRKINFHVEKVEALGVNNFKSIEKKQRDCTFPGNPDDSKSTTYL